MNHSITTHIHFLQKKYMNIYIITFFSLISCLWINILGGKRMKCRHVMAKKKLKKKKTNKGSTLQEGEKTVYSSKLQNKIIEFKPVVLLIIQLLRKKNKLCLDLLSLQNRDNPEYLFGNRSLCCRRGQGECCQP